MNRNFRIDRIKATNFKNFKKLDLTLQNFNVIIGQNASGKSNFVQLFAFLNDIHKHSLVDAIAYQGGSELLCNFSAKKKQLDFEIHFVSEIPYRLRRLRRLDRLTPQIFTNKMIYRFSISIQKDASIQILKDNLEVFCLYKIKDKKSAELKECEGKIWISKNSKITIKSNFPKSMNSTIQDQYEILEFLLPEKSHLLLESPIFGHVVMGWNRFFGNIGIYDFDPKMIKSSTDKRAPYKLSEDGGNITSILNEIIKDKKKLKTLQLLLKNCLDYWKGIKIEILADGSLYFFITESGHNVQIPATFISDGSANLIALFTALYFQNDQLIILEEPERNIHPGLLAKIIDYIKDASEKNQIIITTHNPKILDQIDLSNMFLVIKQRGHSTITKAENHDIVKQFKDTMQIGDMLSNNFLNSDE